MYFSNSNPQSDDRELGAGRVEYALLAGLIASAAFAALVGVSTVGNAMSASMITAESALEEEASSTTTIAPATTRWNVDTGQAGRARFDEIAKDTGRRATVTITTPESGETTIVDDWIDLRDSSRQKTVTGSRSSPSPIGPTAPVPLPSHNRTYAHVITGA
jgi:Flp pilus assembly pilin Flp